MVVDMDNVHIAAAAVAVVVVRNEKIRYEQIVAVVVVD